MSGSDPITAGTGSMNKHVGRWETAAQGESVAEPRATGHPLSPLSVQTSDPGFRIVDTTLSPV